jgi:adenosylcobinamide-GDP ribazoletransferase
MKYFSLAISFLTIFPVRLKRQILSGDLGKSSAWFPLIGLLMGGLITGFFYGVSFVFPPLLASGLTVAVWIGITGGLHLDGLADCCDGMFHASNPERRLEIMKDPRLGAFGVIGLILFILIKVVCVYSLSSGTYWIAIPLAVSSARWLLLWAGKQKMARSTGMGTDFASGITLKSILPAFLVIMAVTILSGWQGVIIVLAAHAAAWLIFRVATKQLGGLTGDVFGLIVEITENIVLLGFCIG